MDRNSFFEYFKSKIVSDSKFLFSVNRLDHFQLIIIISHLLITVLKIIKNYITKYHLFGIVIL